MNKKIPARAQKVLTSEGRYLMSRPGRLTRHQKKEDVTIAELTRRIEELGETTEMHSCVAAVIRRMKKSRVVKEEIKANVEEKDIQTEVEEGRRLEKDQVQ